MISWRLLYATPSTTDPDLKGEDTSCVTSKSLGYKFSLLHLSFLYIDIFYNLLGILCPTHDTGRIIQCMFYCRIVCLCL